MENLIISSLNINWWQNSRSYAPQFDTSTILFGEILHIVGKIDDQTHKVALIKVKDLKWIMKTDIIFLWDQISVLKFTIGL